ncbi:MAG: hypothetical protein ACK559_33720, partial [bacterium]
MRVGVAVGAEAVGAGGVEGDQHQRRAGAARVGGGRRGRGLGGGRSGGRSGLAAGAGRRGEQEGDKAGRSVDCAGGSVALHGQAARAAR